MKKRIVCVLTAAALWLGLLAAVGVASAAAVGDVEEAVAVLTTLGVVSGYSDGLYHPEDGLTRAQFCKLAVAAEGHSDQAVGSGYRSLFSDVSAADWALAYINLAYEEGLMAGRGDGTFGPNDPVTLEQAVTVCLRLLGYTDQEIGPFWPEDYLAKGARLGLLDGLSTDGSDQPMTRGQAALLLYHLVREENAQGKVFGLGLGNSWVSDAYLLDNDDEAADGTLHAAKVWASGSLKWYEQSTRMADLLVGRRGTLLLDKGGRACGFLPDDSLSRTVTVKESTAAAVKDADGNSYAIASDTPVIDGEERVSYGSVWYELEGRDLTLWYAESGGVILASASDPVAYEGVTLTGYYEQADPNTSNPTRITLLGHTFDVADKAAGLSGLGVGEKITVTLNGAGEVLRAWAASEKSTTVVAVLDSVQRGTLTHISGLSLSATEITGSKASELEGCLVKVSATGVGKCSVSALTGSVPGKWDVKAGTVGTVPVSDHLKIYDQVGLAKVVEVAPEDVLVDTVAEKNITYVGTDSKGQVDVLLLNDVTGDGYTYGIYHIETVTVGLGREKYKQTTVAVENGNGFTAYCQTSQSVRDEKPGGMAVTAAGKAAGFAALTGVEQVSRSAFDGEEAVVLENVRVPVSDAVQVYNEQNGSWIDLATAKGYTGSLTVYYSGQLGKDAKVRLVVVEE